MRLVERLKDFAGFGVTNIPGFLAPADDTDRPLDASQSASVALRNAHKNPVVCAVVEWISTQASPTPLFLERLTEDDENVEIVRSHPLLSLLTKPSEFMSGRELLSVSIWDMLLVGQCFWHKDRTNNAEITSLTYLPARRVQVKGTADTLVTEYIYKPDEGKPPITYTPEEIVHIRLEPDPFDPKNGLSPLVCVAKDLMIDEQSTDYTSAVLEGPGGPGGLLMPPPDTVLTDELAKSTRNYIHKEFTGRKRGTLGVLRAFMRYVPTALEPGTMTLRSIQDTSETRIAGALGVHPVIVGLLAGVAQSRVGAATKELERAAWTNRIIPLQDTISEQIGRQLTPEFEPEDADDWVLEWDRSGVLSLQPDMLQEAQRWSLLTRTGIAQRYDARMAQGLEAEDIDRVYLMPSGITVVDADAPPPDPEAPEPEPDAEQPEELADLGAAAWIVKVFPRTKAELDDDQRRLLIRLAEDAEVLEEGFASDLQAAFEDLGSRAVEAFWEVEAAESIRQTGSPRTKQEPPDVDDIGRDVARILRAIKIEEWIGAVTLPLFEQHYLQVLNTTASSINGVLGLAVDIPDYIGRRVVAQGGTRLGLIDISGQTRDSIFQALFEGRSNGEGPAQLARRIQSQVPPGRFVHAGSEYRAKLIARTETKNAQNASTLETYRASDTVTRVLVVDSQIGDFDSPCIDLDGQTLTFEEAEAVGNLAHPNCTRSFSPVLD